MATPSDQLPPWETETETPPWEMETSTVAPVTPPTTTPDSTSQIDKTSGFLSRWWEHMQESPLTHKGQMKLLRNVATGFDQIVFGVLKAPGQAAEAIQNLGEEKPFELTWKAPVSSTLIGSSRLISRLEKEILGAPDPNLPFEEQMLQGAGSALAFMGGGALLGAAGFSPALATGALGGAAGASAQYDEAVNMGATPEQAAIAYAGGAAFGMTEAVPGTLFLNKINKITGGKLLETLKTKGINGESDPLLETIKGGLTEAIQEGVQTVGSNWVASDLAAYDPTRTMGENFWTNVATGGIVGSMLGGGISFVRNGEKNRILKELDDQYQALLASGDPVNFVEGNFTPVGDLLRLRQLEGFAVQEYELAATAAAADAAAGGIPVTDIIPLSKQRPMYLGDRFSRHGENASANRWLNTSVDTDVEKALPKNPDGSALTMQQALEHTPVVAVDANPYQELIDIATQNITKKEAFINANPNNTGPLIETAKKGIEVLKRQRLELLAKQEINRKLVSQVKSYVAAFRQVFSPDMRLVITSKDLHPTTQVGGTVRAASFSYTADVPLPSGQTVPVGTVYVNLDSLVTETYNNKKAAINDYSKQARRSVFEAINHELGHGIVVGELNKIYSTIASPSSTPLQRLGAQRLINLLQQEYNRWLETAAGKNQDFFVKSQTALMRGMAMAMAAPDMAKTPMSADMPKGWPRKEYLLSFDEFFAEMTARIATQGTFADPVMTKYFSSVLPQYEALFQKLPAFAQADYAADYRSYLLKNLASYKVQQELEKVQAGEAKDLIQILRHGLGGFSPKAFAGLREHLDRFDKLISWGFNLIQLAKENPHIEGLQSYLKATAAWAEYQRNFQADANEVYKGWRALGKIEAAQLSQVLFEEALDRKLLDPKILQTRLTAEAQTVYTEIRQQLSKVLEEMRETSLLDVQRTVLDNEELLNSEIKQINEDFDKLAAEGYFPFIRFGQFTITARAREDLVYNGNTYKKGQLISFPAFETEKERDEVLIELRTELGSKANIASSIMRETDFVIQGMPRSLLRALRNKLEAAGNFTTEQAAAFEAVAAEAAPFRNFRKHMLKKKGIHGYSEDAMRSFAAYIRGAAGHLSRVRFNDDLRDSIAAVQNDVEVIKETGGRADERQEIRHWLDRHFDYVMNPGNELAALRGVGFVAYLGFNVKSALVNSTQILTTVAPYLAARYGDRAAISELSKSTWALKDWVTDRKTYLSSMDKLDKGTANKTETKKALMGRMIARGLHEGWLDQSLATELAIAASENNLDRGLYLPKARRFWHEFSRYSALPFHLIEKMNRYITAISAFNLELQTSSDYEKSVMAARQANWSANYENARWNRPEFMRGKKSAFFLFGNYLQNTLYFATRDPGAVRYWLMMLILAGVMGLPGADDVVDLADFAATYLNRVLGLKNPKTQLRVELREHLENLSANPDLLLHGLAQDSFGLGHIGELTGIPVPHLDMSRSIGMGDIIPGTEIPGLMLQSSPNDVLVAAASSLSGAGGSLVEEYYKNLLSTDPDAWKRAEKLLPLVAARNLSKAARLATRGQEVTQSGNVIATYDPYDSRNALELIGTGLGFQPSEQTLGWERQIAVADMIQYYKVQQTSLLKQMNYARWQQDREAVADMMSEIRKYNQQVPMPEMGISSDTMKDSFKSYLEKHVVGGMGLEAEKKYRRLREQTEKAYPDPLGNKDMELTAPP